MAKENAILYKEELVNEDLTESFDFDELEEKLQSQLEEELADMQFLAEEKEKIGSPDNLGNVMMNVVWEQFINQVTISLGAEAADTFIRENNGLTLDLRKSAHIQTAENFEQQKYAKHNTYVDYEKRGEEYRVNFYTDPNDKPAAKQKQEQRYNEKTKVWQTYDNVDDEWKKTLRKEYREPYEEDRRKDKKNKFGDKTINKDHQVADATIARDAQAGAFMTTEEKIKAANSEANLFDLDSAANQSKSDHDGEKWIKHERTGKSGTGQTNGEFFGIDEDEYIEQDKKAKEAWEQEKKKKESENVAMGKKSRKEEAFRIGGQALRAVLMQLLVDLIKEIIDKLVKWFKSAKKGLGTLLDSLKEAITSFVGKMKTHLINAGNAVLSTVAATIIGPVLGTIKRVWALLNQGFKALADAIAYIRNPENKGKPMGRLLMEVGKIVIAAVTGTGAMLLSEVIEKGLSAIPPFGVEIPILGSLANIIGIFLGAVVAGIIGAIAINLIEKQIEKSMKRENVDAQIKKGNEILNLQHQVQVVSEAKLEHTKFTVANDIHDRHVAAAEVMKETLEKIEENCAVDESVQDGFDAIDKLFIEMDCED